MKTTRQAIVVETTLEDIENSDHLAVAKFHGYQVVTNKHSWKIQPSYPKILAIHIPPESLVDSSREEFKFLAKEGKDRWQTVKTCKLRGVLSEGCFIPPLPDMVAGQDVTELFDVRHVEDEPENNEIVSAKPLNSLVRNLHKYDIDSAKNFYKELTQEDEVVATIKTHGCNGLFVYDSEAKQICIRGRTTWQTNNVKNEVYRAYKTRQDVIDKFCSENPTYVLWGEAFGGVGGFRYGLKAGIVDFIAFDIWSIEDKKFLDYDCFIKLCDSYSIPRVVEVYRGPFDFEKLKKLCEVPARYDHPEEGVVIKTVVEKQNSKFERMCFKIISPSFKIGKELTFDSMSLAELEEMRRNIDVAIAKLEIVA